MCTNPDRFVVSECFKYTNNNKTIQQIQTSANVVPVAFLSRNIAAKDKLYYLEITFDKIIKRSSVIIAISQNESISLWDPIILYNLRENQIQVEFDKSNTKHILPKKRMYAYQVDRKQMNTSDSIGFLFDFVTKRWNGCIRVFIKGSEKMVELCMDGYKQPFVQDLCSNYTSPFRLYVSSSQCDGYISQLSVESFPTIPRNYLSLFPLFYTEKRKISYLIKLLKVEDNKSQINCDIDQQIIQCLIQLFLVLNTINMEHAWSLQANGLGDEHFVLLKKINEPMCNKGTCVYDTYLNMKFCRPNQTEEVLSVNFASIPTAVFLSMGNSEHIYIPCAIVAAYLANSYEKSVVAMVNIANYCLINKQYQLAKKILKNCIDHDDSSEIDLNLSAAKIKWANMHCSICKRTSQLKSCKGCMKVAYCGKRCQKKHWKSIHREMCERIWDRFYFYDINARFFS
eukprot:145391_1